MLDVKSILKKAFGIIRLDNEVIKEVGEDKEAFLPALGIIAIGGLLAGIGSIFTGFFAGIIILPIVYLISSFVGTGIIFVIAYLLGGKGSYLSLYKVLGYASMLSWLSIIPFIGWIPSLWILVVIVVALEVVLGLSRKKAITVGVVLFCLWLFIVTISTLGILINRIFLERSLFWEKYLPKVLKFEERKKEEEISERTEEEVVEESEIETKISKLPKDLKEDIPIYKDAKVSTTMTSGGMNVLHLTTSASLEEVAKYYREELKKKGWEIGFTMEQVEEGSIILQGIKNERQIQVRISRMDKEGTSITIMIMTY